MVFVMFIVALIANVLIGSQTLVMGFHVVTPATHFEEHAPLTKLYYSSQALHVAASVHCKHPAEHPKQESLSQS
jgi:hypothetical protein